MIARVVFVLLLVTSTAFANHAAAITKDAPSCDPARPYCFGLQFHVAPGADALVVTPEWIADQVAMANRQFESIGVGFQIAGASVLPASAAYLKNRADRTALAPRIEKRKIHVFVTGKLDNLDGVTPVYGVAWHTANRKFIILAANAWHMVLAHELGHVFGLPHSTHEVSIMNKTKRPHPLPEDRRFADEELATMTNVVKRFVRTKHFENVRYDARNGR